jgi:hypothetical protein
MALGGGALDVIGEHSSNHNYDRPGWRSSGEQRRHVGNWARDHLFLGARRLHDRDRRCRRIEPGAARFGD